MNWKKLLSVFVLLLCCVLFINVGKSIKQKAITNELNNDKYTAEEYEKFKQQLSKSCAKL